MNIEEIILAVQKQLGVEVDGKAGPQTWGAIYKAVVKKQPVAEIKKLAATITVDGKRADSRSEKNIATLHPNVRPYARALVEKAASQGIIVKIISGTRTIEEQAELYKKYKAGGPQAAPPGKSNHNYGIAFDIGVFKGSTDPELAKAYVPESAAYDAVGALAGEIGLSWGGNWKNNKDKPHYALRPSWAADLSESEMISKLAERKAKGIDAFA